MPHNNRLAIRPTTLAYGPSPFAKMAWPSQRGRHTVRARRGNRAQGRCGGANRSGSPAAYVQWWWRREHHGKMGSVLDKVGQSRAHPSGTAV
jgi:hypothetical protein